MNTATTSPTQSPIIDSNYRILDFKFGEYNVAIKLNDRNEFAGIENISVNKIFYNYRSVQSEDVSKFYED